MKLHIGLTSMHLPPSDRIVQEKRLRTVDSEESTSMDECQVCYEHVEINLETTNLALFFCFRLSRHHALGLDPL